jgi:hypothetical protein
MSIFSEPVWFSGRPGEARVCGGCHEDRTRVTNVAPGVLNTFVLGATDMFSATPLSGRIHKGANKVADYVGMGWNTEVQPALAACQECHDGSNTAGIAPYTITNPKTGATITWTFNLSPDPVPAALSVAAGGGAYSSSYFSMAGPDMEAIEKGGLMISGNFKIYMKPLDARGSIAIQMLNPRQIFPAPSETRAFTTAPHLVDKGRPDLTRDELYALLLAADMGMNYFARENKPAPTP